jgi:hypothetical protein
MFARAAFGMAIALAAVSGALAAPGTHAARAQADTQTVHNPSRANIAGQRSHSESAPTIWGWPQDPAYRR